MIPFIRDENHGMESGDCLYFIPDKEISMNQLIDLIMSRHSIREYTGEPVDEADLNTIVRAGMAAPSAVNVQPWAFVIITDRKKLLTLCDRLPYAKMLDKAGAAVVVCGVPDKDGQFAEMYWITDCSAATENILLAAHSMGYGAVWTAVYPEKDRMKSVRDVCGLPENIIPLNVVPVGVPVNKDTMPIDKFRKENIHWNNW